VRLTRSNVIRFVDSTETAAVDIDAWLVVVTQDVGDVLADGGGMTMPVDDDVHAADKSVETRISPNSTWLVTSRVNTTRHVRARRDERVESSAPQKRMGSTRRTCRPCQARRVERVGRVELVETSVSSRAVRQARHSQNAWTRHVDSTRRTCRVVSRRDVTSQVEFGLYSVTAKFGQTIRRSADRSE